MSVACADRAVTSIDGEVHRFPISRGELVIASVVPHEGKTYVDLRRCLRNKAGGVYPTDVGIRLLVEWLPDLARAVDVLRVAVRPVDGVHAHAGAA